MALSATIAVSPSSVQINQKATATVTITSTNSSAVTVQGLAPYAQYTGSSAPFATSWAPGMPNLQANNSAISIAASGTTTIPFDMVFFQGSEGLLNAGSGTYDVGCQINTSDGSVFHPTAATLVVTNISFPTSQQ